MFEEAEVEIKGHSLHDNKHFLASLDHSEESSLSEASSNDFEDVLPPPPKRRKREAGLVDVDVEEVSAESEEEDINWEDAIDEPSTSGAPERGPIGDLDLTLDRLPQHNLSSLTDPHGTKKGPSKIERAVRYWTHCLHVECLMLHNYIRNRWINDVELQKILVSTLPQGCKSELQRWQDACAAAGIQIREGVIEKPAQQTAKPKVGPIAKPQKPKASSSKKHKNQRDWGERADVPKDGPQIDPLLRLLKMLSAFWKKKFAITAPGLRKQGYKDIARLEEEVKAQRKGPHDAELHGERVEDVKKFREMARCAEGSRDVGAQLFTAMLRGLGLEARLVASLQPAGFGWNKSEDANPPKKKANDTTPEVIVSKIGKGRSADAKPPSKPTSALQNGRTRPSGKKDAPIDLEDEDDELSSAPPSDEDDDASVIDVTPRARPTKRYDRDLQFPMYWAEVLSPISHRWIAVDAMVLDVISSDLENHVIFQPLGAKAERAKQVHAYVVAFANDGTAKDVTVRYLKKRAWPGKTKGFRLPPEKVPVCNRRGKVLHYEQRDFFKGLMSCYTAPHAPQQQRQRLAKAEALEDATDLKPIVATPKSTQVKEDSLQGYKTSAEFVLERHLRREEALLPGSAPVRHFLASGGKGGKSVDAAAAAAKPEPVYLRAHVVACRTAESWHKEGRCVTPGAAPLKLVPTRAVTTLRKREIDEAERATGARPLQALYARAQTEWIVPPPIRDGAIPKNAFGNIDVYVPTMVPAGAVHLKLKGCAKVCRRLGVDFAEAVTGFEFGNRRAVPVLTGVVVAREHREAVVAAWRVEAAEKQRKEDAKREKLALSSWKKMLVGLRIVQRVRREYGADADAHIQEAVHPMAAKKQKKKPQQPATARKNKTPATDVEPSDHLLTMDIDNDAAAGGFLRDDEHEHEHDHNNDDDILAGGFLLEDPSNPSPGRSLALPLARRGGSGVRAGPVSLQSLHQPSPIAAAHSASSEVDVHADDTAGHGGGTQDEGSDADGGGRPPPSAKSRARPPGPPKQALAAATPATMTTTTATTTTMTAAKQKRNRTRKAAENVKGITQPGKGKGTAAATAKQAMKTRKTTTNGVGTAEHGTNGRDKSDSDSENESENGIAAPPSAAGGGIGTSTSTRERRRSRGRTVSKARARESSVVRSRYFERARHDEDEEQRGDDMDEAED